MTINATPAKLQNGSWGARCKGSDAQQVKEGDTVTITTRAGKTWDATVNKVLSRGSDYAVISTESESKSSGQSSGKSFRTNGTNYSDQGESCGYACPVDGHKCTPSNPCHDCFG